MKKAVSVTFDKFTDIDIFLAWDLLNCVNYRDKDFQVKIVGTKASHKSIRGLDAATHGLIEDIIASVLPIGQGQVCIY